MAPFKLISGSFALVKQSSTFPNTAYGTSEPRFKSKALLRGSYLLVWLLLCALTPLEAGLVFPEAEDEVEPEAEVEEAPALVTAAFLASNIKSHIRGWKYKCTIYIHRNSRSKNVKGSCDSTHPDLDRGFPSVLQSWSSGWRCLRQKFKWHWSHVTRIISFCLQPPLEHLLVKIWK